MTEAETTTEIKAVSRWIEGGAHRVSVLDSRASLAEVRPLAAMVGDARIVALGASTRASHELSVAAHLILRLLVEELGFRTLALEGDDAARVGLDEYIRTGVGDPQEMLAGARSFWQTGEILDVVRWMRSYNEQHPDDPVRFAASPDPALETGPRAEGLAGIEQALAANTLWWLERSGDRIVYWGGLAHTVNGDPRTVSPWSSSATHRNAGGYLRERLGSGYVSIGLMFHHGSAPTAFPAPPAGFAEAVLGAASGSAYLLDLRAERPEPVHAWLTGPARTRLVGPDYDAGDDAAHHLSGGSLADWFDVLVHVREVTPARPLLASRTTTGAHPDIRRPDSVLVRIREWAVSDAEEQGVRAAAVVGEWDGGPWPDGLLSRTLLVGTDDDALLGYEQWSDEKAAPADPLAVSFRRRLSVVADDEQRVPGAVAFAEIDVDGSEAAEEFIGSITEALAEDPEPQHPWGIAANIHVGTDGRRVINLPEWVHQEHHRQGFADTTRTGRPGWQRVRGIPGVRPVGVRRFRVYNPQP